MSIFEEKKHGFFCFFLISKRNKALLRNKKVQKHNQKKRTKNEKAVRLKKTFFFEKTIQSFFCSQTFIVDGQL
jgi:hypothetical protein